MATDTLESAIDAYVIVSNGTSPVKTKCCAQGICEASQCTCSGKKVHHNASHFLDANNLTPKSGDAQHPCCSRDVNSDMSGVARDILGIIRNKHQNPFNAPPTNGNKQQLHSKSPAETGIHPSSMLSQSPCSNCRNAKLLKLPRIGNPLGTSRTKSENGSFHSGTLLASSEVESRPRSDKFSFFTRNGLSRKNSLALAVSQLRSPRSRQVVRRGVFRSSSIGSSVNNSNMPSTSFGEKLPSVLSHESVSYIVSPSVHRSYAQSPLGGDELGYSSNGVEKDNKEIKERTIMKRGIRKIPSNADSRRSVSRSIQSTPLHSPAFRSSGM